MYERLLSNKLLYAINDLWLTEDGSVVHIKKIFIIIWIIACKLNYEIIAISEHNV